MLQEDINFSVNTSEAEKGLDNLGKKIEDINNPQKKEQQEVKSLTSAQGEMKNLTDAIKENTKQQINSLNNQPSQSLLDRIPNDKRLVDNLDVKIEKMGASINSLIKSFAQGDYVSPVIQGTMSTSQKVKNLGEKIESNNDASDLGSFLKSAGALGLVVGGAVIAGNAMSDRYERDLPQTTRILASFGDKLTDSANQNQKLADSLRATLVDYNRNTGLENNEFLDYASSLSRFGIGEGQEKKAGEITQKAANVALLTNGDIGQNLDFMGLIERFGGNGVETLNQAYNSAKIQGLDKNQFPEFLSNLQRVIEDGISRGYIKSTKEVATDLAIFSNLGKGNVFFEGEYGARNYAQMSSGLANATNLNSTSSMLVFNAAQETIKKLGIDKALNTGVNGGSLNSIADIGASWLNTMAYIESGPMNTDFLKNFSEQVNSTYGNDTASKVLTYKEAFGLNYQGAIRMFNLMDELSKETNVEKIEQIKSEMEGVTNTTEFKSAETSLADNLSKIDKSIHEVSKGAFEIKSAAIDGIANTVDAIAIFLGAKVEDIDFTPKKEDIYLVENYNLNKKTQNGLSVDSGTNEVSWNEILNNDVPDSYRQGTLRQITEDYLNGYSIRNNIEELYQKDVEDGTVSKDILLEYNALQESRKFLEGNPTYWADSEVNNLINAMTILTDHLKTLNNASNDVVRAIINNDVVVSQ